MSTILLLRHGRTALNFAGALRGQIDVPLDEHGIAEARALATRVAAEYRLDAIHCSPLGRARITAQEVGALANVDVQADERFLDIDYGPWSGRNPATLSVAERRAYDSWIRDPGVPLPGGEDPRAVQERAFAGLEALAKMGRTTAIVSHDAVSQLILCKLFNLNLTSYRGIVQHTAALNELEYSDGDFRVRLLNSTWHLSPEKSAAD